MFANFTEETCTGTAATLALAGATADHIAFQESFADGDLVAYALEDSGGVIRVAGIGTYVAATDDITRNDSWNWNGTVVDKNPSSNITLSGGTHTIRCDVTQAVAPIASANFYGNRKACGFAVDYALAFGGFVADRLYLCAFEVFEKAKYTKIGTSISVAQAGSFTRCGVYSMGLDGLPNNLIVESAAIDTSVTGDVSATIDLSLDPGVYYAAIVSSDAIDPFAGSAFTAFLMGIHTDKKAIEAIYTAHTFGSLPADLSGNSFTQETGKQSYVFLEK